VAEDLKAREERRFVEQDELDLRGPQPERLFQVFQQMDLVGERLAFSLD
jgi:hypothetical protein